ncbi:hypothetical protein T06_897, partial [Trichinella sp. T6]
MRASREVKSIIKFFRHFLKEYCTIVMDKNDPLFKEIMYKCYYEHEHCLEDISQLYSTFPIARYLLRSLFLPLKSYKRAIFLAISRQIRICETRFCKVLRQINPYVSNKWPLKLPCAYLNTQQSSRN